MHKSGLNWFTIKIFRVLIVACVSNNSFSKVFWALCVSLCTGISTSRRTTVFESLLSNGVWTCSPSPEKRFSSSTNTWRWQRFLFLVNSRISVLQVTATRVSRSGPWWTRLRNRCGSARAGAWKRETDENSRCFFWNLSRPPWWILGPQLERCVEDYDIIIGTPNTLEIRLVRSVSWNWKFVSHTYWCPNGSVSNAYWCFRNVMVPTFV